MKPSHPLLLRSFRQARLTSGLILLAYVVTHFINHMLGLISLDAMEKGLEINSPLWAFPIMRVLLYGAMLTHIVLALWSIYRRTTLRMSAAELMQTVLGFSVPFLAAQHVVNTRVGALMFDAGLGYSWEVYAFWVVDPVNAIVQMALLAVVWLHACIGLHFWLKLKPWFPRASMLLFTLAILIPTLAALGFVSAGHAVELLAADPAWVAAVSADARVPSDQQQQQLFHVRDLIWLGILCAIALTLAARGVRWLLLSRRGVVLLTYANGRTVSVLHGTSVLEASRIAGIPHASICGGRGRCSTCRIRVSCPSAPLDTPSDHEQIVLRRVGMAPDVRLACQLRPVSDLSVSLLLPATATARDGFARPAILQGGEREIAILFADIRGFTKMAEHKLPYDVVFLLNRYFLEMGTAVESAGGYLDKFIGDGVMALFGIENDIETGCRQALVAARNMSERLIQLNQMLEADLSEPIRIGIGVHAGLAIVGEMGYGTAVNLTAIGDSVNTASRLESLSKDYQCQLVVSQDLAQKARIDLSAFPHHTIDIRGRMTALEIHAISDAQDLPQFASVKA